MSLNCCRAKKIIDAVRRLGFDAPQSCRNGNCHICAANLISGKVRQGSDIFESGELFTCLAEPLSDCELHWDGVLAANELPLCKVACQLVSVTPLGADVFRCICVCRLEKWCAIMPVSIY